MKVRKGFTLVELLIVIAILGALSATMSVATSGSTAKAKAAAIAANVEACKSAAALYLNNGEQDATEKTAGDVLGIMIPTWVDFSDTATKGTKYASTEDKTSDTWAITVDFIGEPDKDDVKTELQKIKGYKKYNKETTTTEDSTTTTTYTPADIFEANKYSFKVTLLSGKIEPAD